GASDDLSSGRSTFMVEMSEVSEILKNATGKSLVILDEIGRGTSTFDGMSIAKAVVEYIYSKNNNLGCKTLFATHYHELTDMEDALPGVVNYNIAVKKRGDEITFLRKIVKGGADDSFGIQVAKLAGVPDAVIERAKVILAELEENARREKMAVRQLSFDDAFTMIEETKEAETPSEIVSELEKVDVNVLTPIEALNILNKLKSMI
ncbi:MAG: DNA mismatch repair protein MutS, partial [Oscillospiraceae bacterium]|nr:DNA mismatch repair protein MutS [Oscillospiraceae bacterium]